MWFEGTVRQRLSLLRWLLPGELFLLLGIDVAL